MTKVTSPAGRTATSTSSQSNSYARTETYLAWDFDDPGRYFIETRHWMCCPYMGGNPYTGQGCFPSSTTSSNPFFGVSFAQYVNVQQYPDGTGLFAPITGCNVECKGSNFVSQLNCPSSLEYWLRMQAWFYSDILGTRVCVPPVKFVQLANCSQQLGQCYDGNTF